MDVLDTVISEAEKKELELGMDQKDTPLWKYWGAFKRQHLRTQKSKATVRNAKDAIRWAIFHLELKAIEDFYDIVKLDDLFHKYKEARNISGGTFNSYRKNLNTYFIWLKRFKFIEENPITNIPKCTEVKRPKQVLTEEQVSLIVKGVMTRPCEHAQRARDRFLIDLLRATGARPCEIAVLKLSDIIKKGGDRQILINGAKQKGKVRPYRLKGFLSHSCDDYMALRPKFRSEEEWLLLSRRRGHALGLAGMRKLCKDLSKELGFKFSIYGFRRYVATTLYKEGLSLDKIGRHMGHVNQKTTQLYIDDLAEFTDEGMNILTNRKDKSS